ncbi:hypothetical protein PR003_g17389 [Phytophthora rubi]|uniref:Uncharacterized protein n=1 Tax=Phytophthora rubi TaxID=129364 RepID=A0A6A4EES3_9STRA|nr:hypothetical protein PR002_g16880 [Phytophthora rubi]KAE9010486.1 hypothetical protein PR001_g16163 [Phytophthora rubi]KAE9321786.1 hypothetical protein PR003_g17389 [Phytophthora rubi]
MPAARALLRAQRVSAAVVAGVDDVLLSASRLLAQLCVSVACSSSALLKLANTPCHLDPLVEVEVVCCHYL